MSRLLSKTAAGFLLLVVVSPACVVRLTDRNEAADNGAITGPPADCSTLTPEGPGGPGGAAELKFVGRFDFGEPNKPEFDWSGNYIQARFMGDQVTVDLDSQDNDLLFTAVVDDRPPIKIRHQPKKPNSPRCNGKPVEQCPGYEIAVGLDPNVPHEVTLHRNSEAMLGPVAFLGFTFGAMGKLLPPNRRPRRIEIIGDSITCGYGNEGENATCPFDVEIRKEELTEQIGERVVKQQVSIKLPITENQYLAYSSIAARNLNADIVTLCWSGKGVVKNYKERYLPAQQEVLARDNERLAAAAKPDVTDDQIPPPYAFDCDSRVTVPDMWLSRTRGNEDVAPPLAPAPHPDPGVRERIKDAELPRACSLKSGGNEKGRFVGPKWDFSKEKPDEQPQVVVINLGTNDFARDSIPDNGMDQLPGDNLPDGTIDRGEFRNRYRDFIQEIRKVRPNAHIIMQVPPMITDQFPLDNAREDMKSIFLSIADEFASKGDFKVYRMELVEQGVRYGLGCDYHPNLEVHRIMARQLEGAIRNKTCWQ